MIDKFAIDYQRVLITMSLLKNVEDSDYTEKHSLRVGRLVKKISAEFYYDISTINFITRSAYFHDVGKIKLSKKVLFTAGRLDEDGLKEMKQHPIFSSNILNNLGLSGEADIAVQHHERLNGSGYPHGLVGDEIKTESRILAVADVFDAITTERPYRKGFTIKNALLYLYSCAKEQYDLKVVKALHNILEKDKKLKDTLDI